MPAKQTYLIRRMADGTQRTIIAQSPRGAMQLFVAGYGPPIGEDFGVKIRGEGGWEYFRVTSGGIRKLAD
jgi:hypothetical protein